MSAQISTNDETNQSSFITIYYDQENTQLKEKYFQINGKKEGTYIMNFESGKPYKISNYVDGLLNGKYQDFYANGNRHRICNYVDGKIVGEYKSYFPGGDLKHIIRFENGEKVELLYDFFNDDLDALDDMHDDIFINQ